MTRLGFLWAKATGDEAALEAFSVPQSELLADLQGKRVALIGNARSLSQLRFGPEIEAADLVIRLNTAPIPAEVSHGARTDWIALSTPVEPATLTARNPKRLLWMTRKRRRMSHEMARRPGFYLNRLPDILSLRARLGGSPTTGLMMIDLLARSEMTATRLYGFDFFTSLSLSGSRTATQVPHDFAAERVFVDTLIARDPRFSLRP